MNRRPFLVQKGVDPEFADILLTFHEFRDDRPSDEAISKSDETSHEPEGGEGHDPQTASLSRLHRSRR